MTEIKLPSMGEGVEKGTVVSILVKVGDNVSIDQPLMEVETDKVTAEVPCEQAGEIIEILVNLGDEIPEGTPIFKIKTLEKEPATDLDITSTVEAPDDEGSEQETKMEVINPQPGPALSPQTYNATSSRTYRASPLAKKVAREIGVDLSKISLENGTGRISVKDVKAYAKSQLENGVTPMASSKPIKLPDFSKWGTITKESMTSITQATSRNMSQAWSQIPHAWLQEKADITDLEQKRKTHKKTVKERGGSLTITAILVKAVASALRDYPRFNASVDLNNKEIVYKDYINIGVAVDTEKGLVVPAIKNADQKSLTDIAIDLTTISARARDRKLKSEDLEGASFTISNLGGIGTTAIFPIVNHPQVAILGISASSTEPVWEDEKCVPRLVMPMTIGFDHRIINGAEAARFIRHIKSLLEDWFLISL